MASCAHFFLLSTRWELVRIHARIFIWTDGAWGEQAFLLPSGPWGLALTEAVLGLEGGGAGGEGGGGLLGELL